MRKKKLRNTRPKALFGESVAAAAISAAATMAAAGIGAAATARAAKDQSAATIENARQQAASIEATNTNNNMLQQQSQQFISQENEANRQIQRDLQMNLQMQAGQLDSEQRRAASRIQVKKGGKTKSRKRLRDAQFPLRGSNIGFTVTDGGGVLPIGITPEGYDIYEIIGNDHNHYHKTKSGKYKSGVGIKFDTGEVVEGEGNQNGKQGEYLIATPDSGLFISKHTMNGVNPAQLVNEGVNPIDAYNIQESIKTTSPVKKNRYAAMAGASTNYILPTDYPINTLGFDMTVPNIVASRRSLKKGGRCKAALGVRTTPTFKSWLNGYAAGYGTTPYTSTNDASRRNKWYNGLSGNLIGAGLTTLGNVGGAMLTNWGASRASRALNNAYLKSSQMLADAYSNLKTVDMSTINRDMFSNSHYMPVTRAAYYNVNDQLEDVNRDVKATRDAMANTTLSDAVRNSRRMKLASAASQARSKIYADRGNRQEAIEQENLKQINEAAAKNAELDIAARRDYTGAYIDLMKYNNDIVNERITGRAQALADGLLGGAGARAAYMQSAGQSWGNAIAGSGQAFGNALTMDTKQRNDLQMALAGASTTGQYNYYMSNNNYDRSGAYGVYSDFVAMSKSAKDSRDRDEWIFRANQLAKKYDFPTV